MAEVAEAPRGASWLPLCFSIRGGSMFSQLATQMPATSNWHAIRNAKELLRSEHRAWLTYGVYRQLGLMHKAWQLAAKGDTAVSQDVGAAAAASGRDVPGSCSCSTHSRENSSCSSSYWSDRTSTPSSHYSLGVSWPSQAPAVAGAAPPAANSNSCSKGDSTASVAAALTTSGSSGAVGDLDSECEGSMASGGEGRAGGFPVTESDRAVPAAASSLLRFPRVFPGYHFPPQPSAVPMAFFRRPYSPKSSSSTAASTLASTPEPVVVPMSRIQLLQCMLADTAAATIQRCIRGYFIRLRYQAALVWRRLLQQQQQREHRAATRIQCAWRRLKAMEELLRRRTARELLMTRERAAIKIQSLWRMHAQQFLFQTERLTQCLLGVRRLAAIEIQRAWRGRLARKVLDEEWEAWVVKWVWDKPSAIVEVIGDFSSPPWTKRHLMTYCHIRDCFVLALPRRPGRHELKFIVNGRYVCDGSQTVIADGSGHFNNLVRVRPSAPSQFRLIRQRLAAIDHKRKAMERSISSPALHAMRRNFCADEDRVTHQPAYSYSRPRRMSIYQDTIPPLAQGEHEQQQHQQQHEVEPAAGSTGPPLIQQAFDVAGSAYPYESPTDGAPLHQDLPANAARTWQLTSVCASSDIETSRASSLISNISSVTAPREGEAREGSYGCSLAAYRPITALENQSAALEHRLTTAETVPPNTLPPEGLQCDSMAALKNTSFLADAGSNAGAASALLVLAAVPRTDQAAGLPGTPQPQGAPMPEFLYQATAGTIPEQQAFLLDIDSTGVPTEESPAPIFDPGPQGRAPSAGQGDSQTADSPPPRAFEKEQEEATGSPQSEGRFVQPRGDPDAPASNGDTGNELPSTPDVTGSPSPDDSGGRRGRGRRRSRGRGGRRKGHNDDHR